MSKVVACFLGCVDFRYVQRSIEFLQKKGILGSCDVFSIPGGGHVFTSADSWFWRFLARLVVVHWLRMIWRIHKFEELFFYVHLDCGGVGGSSVFNGNRPLEDVWKRHEVEKITKYLQKKLPMVKISGFYFEDWEKEQKQAEVAA